MVRSLLGQGELHAARIARGLRAAKSLWGQPGRQQRILAVATGAATLTGQVQSCSTRMCGTRGQLSNLNSPLPTNPPQNPYRPNRLLPRPVSTVLDPLQPIPDRKKRLPLQIAGTVLALVVALALAATVWLLGRPIGMSVDGRLLQGRTALGDLLPEPLRPLTTSKRVHTQPEVAPTN